MFIGTDQKVIIEPNILDTEVDLLMVSLVLLDLYHFLDYIFDIHHSTVLLELIRVDLS